jgi:hypothetical protein
VSGELVRPGKRRENGEKEGGHGGGGDHFKSARRGGGRPAGWRHVAGEGRERGERGGGGLCGLAEGEGGRAGSAAVAADTWARQHCATRFGFKPIRTESTIFQTYSKFSKF